MNTYECQFFGRLLNEYGKTRYNKVVVQAETADQAHCKLYEDYEDIMSFTIKNIDNPQDVKDSKYIH